MSNVHFLFLFLSTPALTIRKKETCTKTKNRGTNTRHPIASRKDGILSRIIFHFIHLYMMSPINSQHAPSLRLAPQKGLNLLDYLAFLYLPWLISAFSASC
jgi:hypothetical protein